MNQKDIRWEQRISNYWKALAKMEEVVSGKKLHELSELEKEGLSQRFEYTFELAWNTLQDLLAYKGYTEVKGPNPVLQQALKDGYIDDEENWRSLRKSRNATAHTYNSDTADSIAEHVYHTYFGLLKKLESRLEDERSGKQGDTFEL